MGTLKGRRLEATRPGNEVDELIRLVLAWHQKAEAGLMGCSVSYGSYGPAGPLGPRTCSSVPAQPAAACCSMRTPAGRLKCEEEITIGAVTQKRKDRRCGLGTAPCRY